MVTNERSCMCNNYKLVVIVYNDNRISIGDSNHIRGSNIASSIKHTV